MFYRPNIATDTDLISVDDTVKFDGQELKRDIRHLADRFTSDDINSLILTDESFVIAVQGGWGTGKTWATWALINYLKKKNKGTIEYLDFYFELLPFANINESVTHILGKISNKLWEKGIVDIRKELKQVIIDSTPIQELDAGMSLFGLSLSRKISVNDSSFKNKDQLKEKLLKVHNRNQRIIIVLDELDRLKPDEVIIVTRMVDSFKKVPGIIFVLPFNREVVANSIKESLLISDNNSHVYLRKFIKSSITIKLSITNLKNSFTSELQFNKKLKDIKAIKSHFDRDIDEIIWYILLNALLLKESLADIGINADANDVSRVYPRGEKSNYLGYLYLMLRKGDARSVEDGDSTLPFFDDNKWKRFSHIYRGLSEPTSSVDNTLRQLKSMYTEDMLSNHIYTDTGLIDELKTRSQVNFDSNRNLSSKTVFEILVLPNIEKSIDEPYLTDNYSRRDMEQLGRAIFNELEGKINPEPTQFVKDVSRVVRNNFFEYR